VRATEIRTYNPSLPERDGTWVVYECGHSRELFLDEVEELARTRDFNKYKNCPYCPEVTDEEFWSAARRSGTGPEMAQSLSVQRMLEFYKQHPYEFMKEILKDIIDLGSVPVSPPGTSERKV